MLYQQIGNFVALYKASGIPVEPLDPDFFQEFPIPTWQESSHGKSVMEICPSDHEKYAVFFKKLTTKIIPTWSALAALPSASLRPLLELVDDYFKEANGKKSTSCFSQKVLKWAAELQNDSSTEESKCLFGQIIQTGEETFYLNEILAKCLKCSFTDEDTRLMRSIARWLCLYDASLIGSAQELEDIYAGYNIGPAFNITCLRAAILALPGVKGSFLEKESIKLARLLAEKHKIDTPVKNAVLEFFRLRWAQMLDAEASSDPNDRSISSYLVRQKGINEPWIRLAQTLGGAGWLKPGDGVKQGDGNLKHLEQNYYAILMPTTAGYYTDPFKLRCVAAYDLYRYILSDNNQGLILFDNSIEQFEEASEANEVKKFGCYHNSTYNRPFTVVELRRIQAKLSSKEDHPHVVKIFQKYFPFARAYTEEPDMPIYEETVNALIRLVNASTFANGLQYREKYNEEQMEAAGAAYHRFYKFMHKQSSPDEVMRLKKQRIRYKGLETTFGQIIYDVGAANTDDGCIAGCNKLIIALILSYVDTQFSPEVERIIERDQLRKSPVSNFFRDYESLEDEEVKRRILILLVSIMSHYFQYPWFGNSVSLDDCSNTMVDVTDQIFKLLSGTIIKGSTLDFEHGRHVYAKIMESLVKPALVSNTTWYRDTYQWLLAVASGTLFQQKHAWIKPEILLATLAPMSHTEPALYQYVGKFLDRLVAAYTKPDHSTDFKELRVNVMFAQLLQSLDPKIRGQLLDSLATPQNSVVRKNDFVKLYVGYVIQRLAYIGITASQGHRVSFFSSPPAPSKSKINQLAKLLVGRDINSMDKMLQHLTDKIDKIGLVVCNEQGKQAMRAYLAEIKGNVDATASIAPLQRPRSPTTEFFTSASYTIPSTTASQTNMACLSTGSIL